MTLTAQQLEEIADAVIEEVDMRIAQIDVDDAIDLIDAVKSSLEMREDALREDRRLRAAAAEASE
jgi:hypothetical protein